MTISDLRKEALLFAIVDGYEEVVDRLLDAGVDLPEVHGDFYITVDGVALCIAEQAFVGSSDLICESTSLQESIRYRANIKAAFPGATVAVLAGSCPATYHAKKAA